MKTKLITTLTALLMLVGIGAQAQTDNQTRANAESTDLEGDLNHDGKVDVADVTYLVNLIMKNQSEAKDGTYYWYIGVDNPTTISDIQTDNTKPGWHEIGESLSGFEFDTNNQANWVTLVENATSMDDAIQYYVVIPDGSGIYNESNMNMVEDIQIFYPVTCNIPGYNAYQYYTKAITVYGPIIKECLPVSGLSISTSESSINVGNTLQLGATVSPYNAYNRNVMWSSSNPEIATVDETTGLVTGVAVGTTTITATSVDGGKTATATVEVVETLSGYYWYIGVDNPASISDIQTDNTKPGWHEIGSTIDDFVFDTNPKENQVVLYKDNKRAKYYVVIPNDLYIYNALNIKEENRDDCFTSETCNIPGYKAFRYVPEQSADGVRVVRGLILKSYQTKYFWYAGADMLTSETVPGSGTEFPMVTTSEDQIGWHQIKGTPSSIATGSLNNGEQINWVLAVPTTYGLTRISDGEDVTDAYDVSTVTAKDGIEYTVFKQKSATQRTDCAFVEGGTKYYWYIGAENPTSISDIQSDNSVAGWHEIGTSTFDFRLDTNYRKNEVVLSEENIRFKYYVVLPNHLHIYDSINRNVESLYFTSEECNIPGYKAFRYVPEQSADGVRVVRGIIIKENDD